MPTGPAYDCAGCTTSDGYLIPTPAPIARRQQAVVRPQAIVPRSPPTAPQPLLPLKEDPIRIITRLAREAMKTPEGRSGGYVGISPDPRQVSAWKVEASYNGKKSSIPVGITAQWHPFTDERAIWRVEGLQGCTMMIVAVSFCPNTTRHNSLIIDEITEPQGILGHAYLGSLQRSERPGRF